jgi:hypothetical protein
MAKDSNNGAHLGFENELWRAADALRSRLPMMIEAGPTRISQSYAMPDRPAISRKRVIDHGEVFTPPGLVNDMLDLVAHECERTDSRFLEPACGTGNFLAEVLRRRLTLVDRRYKPRTRWEPNALLGLACLYGIELLHDNVNDCRLRLRSLFAEHYVARYGKQAKPAFLSAAWHIVRCNILHGDALKMTTVGDHVHRAQPLVYTEWSLLPRGKFKRRRYEYHDLTQPPPEAASALFVPANPRITDEEGKPVYIPCKVGDWPPVHYLDLGEFEGER